MHNGWSPLDVVSASPIGGAVAVSNQPVTKEYTITAGGALNCVIKIVAINVAFASSITAQHQVAIGNDWINAKNTSISSDGIFYITYEVDRSADQTYLPLLAKGRIVISTADPSDEVTITEVDILQML